MKKIIKFIKDKKQELLYLFIGVCAGVLIMCMFWPERIATLDNGEEVIAEIKGMKITANDLYEKLKDNSGVDGLLDIIDNYILHEKYDLESVASEEAKTQAKNIYDNYQNYYGYTKEEFLSSNNFKNEEEFLEYLKNEYYYKHYYDEYTASKITDKELKKYYDTKVFGAKTIYMFTSKGKDDLEGVRSMLKKGKTLDEIKEKYSNVTANSYDNVTYQDEDNFSETVLTKLTTLKKGKYTEIFEDSVYGYVVLYVVDEKEKEDYDKIKDDIKNILVADAQENDAALYYQAFINLRKEYGLKFYDTSLESNYKDTIKSYE